MSTEQAERDPVELHFAEVASTLNGRVSPGGRPPSPQRPAAALADGSVRRPPGAAPIRPGSALTGQHCLDLFDAQLASRHLDVAARWLRARGAGFYTIGSSGHEGNAGVAAALRLTDPALLHYRSGAFFLARAQQASPPHDGVRDVLLGLVAATDEPIAGGRHKVFGSQALDVIPQTSTIASHLPRAMGLAFALDRAARLGQRAAWPSDAIVVASLGDASLNHSTAAGAINTAAYCAFQHLPLPLLMVFEDNGLGISVRTPPGWVGTAIKAVPGIGYFHAHGADLAAVYDTAQAAAAWVRDRRSPAFLHLDMVRFGGHAGSDVESGYRTPADLAADLAADPLLGTARLLARAGVLTPAEVIARYEQSRPTCSAWPTSWLDAPRLASAEQVMAPLAPHRPDQVWAGACLSADPASRHNAFAGRLPEQAGALTLAQSVNAALTDALAARPGMLVFGEDVARKGGVYGVTRGLLDRFGAPRVFDTLLDE